MTTALFSHPACLGHRTPIGHPESPDRLRAVLRALAQDPFQELARYEAPAAPREALLRAHTPALVQQVLEEWAERAGREGFVHIDADTVVSEGSAQAALCAAGAVIAAVDLVVAGSAKNAFCAVRPPGHHAGRSQAMGFCLFNNVAVGAWHARAVHGLSRVAIVDFDVHHGNGTQDIAFADPGFFYASTHQSPLYPGTGAKAERGLSGNIVNAPLAAGADGAMLKLAFEGAILPALEAFRPQIVLISAGFDGHLADPLAGLRFDEADFAWVTEQICGFAARHCGGRVVSTLEGGYDLAALARSAASHVAALMAAP